MPDSEILVTCVESKPHDLTTGDFIKFMNVQGMEELNTIGPVEITYVSPIKFKVKYNLTNKDSKCKSGEIVEHKMPTTFKFSSLEQSLNNPEFVMSDFTDFTRSNKLHAMFRAFQDYKRLPKFDAFKEQVKKYLKEIEISDTLLEQFYYTWYGQIVPFVFNYWRSCITASCVGMCK